MAAAAVSGAGPASRPGGGVAEVLGAFLRLGLTSFGGPIAHLGYFHREVVTRRGWVDEAQYAQLVALCQSLPGPASSQLGFALGLVRAGWAGALAAFVAFTLPSALLLVAFAGAADRLSGPWGAAALHGLKLVAVAVVADGVRRMARQLSPELPRALIAIVAAVVALLVDLPLMQLAVVAGGALLGWWLLRPARLPEAVPIRLGYGRRTGAVLLTACALLLGVALAVAASAPTSLAGVAAGFYRAGALVFGGGHVVLPLLQEAVVASGRIGVGDFLAGYGAAQAVPGPMFTLAAFLGARLEGVPPGFGATVCLLAIFLPGLLLVAGALPWWRSFVAHPAAGRALAGVNAAVVGLLGAALWDPVVTNAIATPVDAGIAVAGFAVLAATRASPLVVVAWCVGASVAGAGLALG